MRIVIVVRYDPDTLFVNSTGCSGHKLGFSLGNSNSIAMNKAEIRLLHIDMQSLACKAGMAALSLHVFGFAPRAVVR
jgi:hypothetical protein